MQAVDCIPFAAVDQHSLPVNKKHSAQRTAANVKTSTGFKQSGILQSDNQRKGSNAFTNKSVNRWTKNDAMSYSHWLASGRGAAKQNLSCTSSTKRTAANVKTSTGFKQSGILQSVKQRKGSNVLKSLLTDEQRMRFNELFTLVGIRKACGQAKSFLD